MVPLVKFPMVPSGESRTHALSAILATNGLYQCTIGTNGITNGTIGRTLNDIGIPLVPLVEP